MANLGKVVYLSEQQKNELFTNNTITVDGVTINYSDNDIYATPDDESVNGTITDNNQGDLEFSSSGYAPVITPLTATQNGTYTAPSNVGYSPIIVDTSLYCTATLSSAGWYRVLHVANPTGSISRVIDLIITRNYVNANNESHCIKYIGNYNSHSFNDEVSKSNTILVDKVRYTTDSNYGYVDIHYAGTSANKIAVDFECYADIGLKQSCVAESLQSVANAPSGETVVTTYNFVASTQISGSVAGSYGTIYYNRKGDVCSIYGDVTGVPTGSWTTLATGLPAPAITQFFIAQNGSSNDFVMCQLNTSGTLKFYGRGSYSSGYPTQTYICN